jgi:hypothetical protein
VFDQRRQWTGQVTFQDVTGEIVGGGGDEFESPPAEPLATLTPGRVTLQLDAAGVDEAVARMVVDAAGPPLPHRIRDAWSAGGRAMTQSGLENGVLLVTGTDAALEGPVTLFGRSETGIPVGAGLERASLVFLVLLPPEQAHLQAEIRESVSSLMESDYLRERLLQSEDPVAIVEALREGVQVALV